MMICVHTLSHVPALLLLKIPNREGRNALLPVYFVRVALLGLLITLVGTVDVVVMSAIKRDASVKNYSSLIEVHGGVMDRIDSFTFVAPVFFHVVRYYFATR